MVHRTAMKTSIVVLIVCSLLTVSAGLSAQDVIELDFAQPPAAGSDTVRTLQSMVKVQGTGIFTQDGLYLMTHFGDREDIFNRENQSLIDNPLIDQTWRHCSVFSTITENSVVMGRNWDNQTVGSIIVNLYHPPGGYSSISFSRSIDVGFGHKDLEQHKTSIFSNKLLLAPFYATDGINEHRLAIAVTGVNQSTVHPIDGKKQIYITFLIRKILDQAKTVEEAVNLAESFVPFDIDKNTLTSHLIVTDSSGQSVILEYEQDHWTKTYIKGTWQVLTTKPIHGVPDSTLMDQCWRYRSISENLVQAGGNVDWEAAMKMLKDASQKGTAWSVVYSLTSGDIFFSVYKQWDTVYHLRGF